MKTKKKKKKNKELLKVKTGLKSYSVIYKLIILIYQNKQIFRIFINMNIDYKQK